MRVKSVAQNIALIIISLAVILLVGEGAVRTLQVFSVMDKVSKKSMPGLNVLRKTPYDQYNANVIPSKNKILASEYDRRDPNINSLGLRGKETTLKKPNNVVRVALMGDSYTYGFSVPVADIFATQLEGMLNKNSKGQRYEVLNFGRSSYGTVQELELYKTYAVQFSPDIVVLNYVLNDVTNTQDLKDFFNKLGAFRKNIKHLSRYSQFLGWLYLKRIDAEKKYWVTYRLLSLYEDEQRWEGVRRSVAQMSVLTKNNNSRFVTVIFPFLESDMSLQYTHEKIHKKVSDLFVELNIPYIDLLNNFPKTNLQRFKVSKFDGHPNAEGHKIAAQAMFDFLQREQIIAR